MRVSACETGGRSYFRAKAPPNVADLPTFVFDEAGNQILACGGMPPPREGMAEYERRNAECAQYPATDCVDRTSECP